MTHLPPVFENERRFARDQARLLVAHLENEDVDFAFVARHALALLQIAEFAWESPHQVALVDSRA